MNLEGHDLWMVLNALETKVVSLRLGGTPGSQARVAKYEGLRARVRDSITAERVLHGAQSAAMGKLTSALADSSAETRALSETTRRDTGRDATVGLGLTHPMPKEQT